MHPLCLFALRDPICASKLLSVFADGEAPPPESLEDRLAEVSLPYGGLEGFIETLALILQKEGRLLWLSMQIESLWTGMFICGLLSRAPPDDKYQDYHKVGVLMLTLLHRCSAEDLGCTEAGCA